MIDVQALHRLQLARELTDARETIKFYQDITCKLKHDIERHAAIASIATERAKYVEEALAAGAFPKEPFTTRELALELLAWFQRDIPQTVVTALKVVLKNFVNTGVYDDKINELCGCVVDPPLLVQRVMAENSQLRDRAEVAEKALAEALQDAQRLDWFEKRANEGGCPSLICDDAGHWAVAEDGINNVVGECKIDVQTTFFISAEDWQDSVRAAIDQAKHEQNEPQQHGDLPSD